MIATWMLYSVLTATLFGVAAGLLERGLLAGKLPARWMWVMAFAASLGACAAIWLVPARAGASWTSSASGTDPMSEIGGASAPWAGGNASDLAADAAPLPTGDHGNPQKPLSAPPVAGGGEAGSWEGGPLPLGLPSVGGRAAGAWNTGRAAVARWNFTVPSSPLFDRSVAGLWLATSLLLLGRMAIAHVRLGRLRRSWRTERVAGVEVLVSPRDGPAVVGFLRATVLLPEWAVQAPPEKRRLLLAHEVEHLRAGDHRWGTAATLALMILPWNLPLWWQLRRLRHAIELDCDARVLGSAGSPGEYGSLLLEVALRGSRGPVRATGFADPSPYIEQRIRAVFAARRRGWRIGLGARAVASLGMVLVALAIPRPAVSAHEPTLEAPAHTNTLPAGSVESQSPIAGALTGGPEASERPRSGTIGDAEPDPAPTVPTPAGVASSALRTDSAGVEIVETPVPAWSGGGEWTVRAEPLLSIGRDADGGEVQGAGAAPDVFGAVTGALRLSDGSIVVADGSAGDIRYFDATGRFVRAAGGLGDGPDRFEPGGEFRRSPFELRQCGNGRIYAIEPFRRLVSVWNADGGFERAFDFHDPGAAPIDPPTSRRTAGAVRSYASAASSGPLRPYSSGARVPYPYRWACSADGGFVVGSWDWRQAADSAPVGPSLYEARGSVWVLDSLARPALELGEHRLAERVALSTPERSWTDAPHPLGHAIVFAGDGLRTYVADAPGLSVRVYDRRGALVRVQRSPAADLAVTEVILDSARHAGPAWSRWADFMMADSLGIDLPATLPGASRMLLDPLGNLWVQRFRLPWEPTERWGVFSPDGSFLGHVIMPDGFSVHEIGQDWLLGVHTDTTGVERVRLHRLTRSH